MFYMLGEEGGRVLVTLIVYTIFIYFVSQLLNSHTNSLCFCFLTILMTYLDHITSMRWTSYIARNAVSDPALFSFQIISNND